MIPMKANDVRDLPFRLLQQAEDSDPDSVVVKTVRFGSETIRFKPWDLTGCVVACHVRRNGDASATVISPTITAPATGEVTVRIGTSVTAVNFAAGEQHRDASLEFQVARSDGTKETTPDDGYDHIRIFRDLDQA